MNTAIQPIYTVTSTCTQVRPPVKYIEMERKENEQTNYEKLRGSDLVPWGSTAQEDPLLTEL